MDQAVKNAHWTREEIRRLRELAKPQTLFMKEIAEQLGRSIVTTRWKAKQLGIVSKPKGRKGKWNSKHAHLREPAMKYFLTHTWEETRVQFGLTQSELKSLFTVGYRSPELRHLRKETRRHDSWTTDETLFLLQHAGIQPREWIARKLSRGTRESVKEQLSRLRTGVKYMNGMPIGWLQTLLPPGECPEGIKTKAGPTGDTRRGSDFRYRILPWVEAEELLKDRASVPEEVVLGVQAMARFQRWVFGLRRASAIRKRIEASLRER